MMIFSDGVARSQALSILNAHVTPSFMYPHWLNEEFWLLSAIIHAWPFLMKTWDIIEFQLRCSEAPSTKHIERTSYN